MIKNLTVGKHIYHEDLQGSVSWKTADTGESIPVNGSARETFTVYLLCPDGNKIKEDCYEGREFFGGHDVNTLLANWNWPEQCTGDPKKDAEIGRKNVWRHGDGIKYPVKLVRNQELNYEKVEASEPCEFHGWDYEIEEWPIDFNHWDDSVEDWAIKSEILNKYSEERVLAFYEELGIALVEVHYPFFNGSRAESIHFVLGYASYNLTMYMPTNSYAQSYPEKYYAEDDLLIWIPEDEIFNFFRVMIDNQNGFVIGNGGFIS